MELRRLPQSDPRLGRHVEHDPRSRAYPAWAAEPPVESVIHRHYGRVLDQRNVGSCTGNAMAQCLMAMPLRQTGRTVSQRTALALYHRATQLDSWPGEYPPEDTGSSGLAVAKAAAEAGLISRYEHAFGIDHARAALVGGPAIIGTAWYEAMFTPDAHGEVRIGGQVAGGHEYLCLGFVGSMYHFLNSWGRDWGVASDAAHISGGTFWMSTATFAALLEDQGDVTQPLA